LFTNPLVRKIAIYAAIVAGGLLLLRWYSNRAYYQGVDAGARLEAKRLVKAKEVEWKAKEDELALQSKQLAEQSKVLDDLRVRLTKIRSELDKTLADIEARDAASVVGAQMVVASVSASELNGALRVKSDELAHVAGLSVPVSDPLSDTTSRQILLQLYELSSARDKITSYEDFIKEERDLDTRDLAVWQQTLDNEKRATELAQKETTLAQEQAKFYKDLYETLSKKRGGAGCTIKKILTLGIYRCKS
jgi:hypothetical protein